MFCANCGFRSTPGVNFCKQCGSNLTSLNTSPLPESTGKLPKVTSMFWAVALFGLGALGVLFGSIIALAAMGADDDIIIPSCIFGTAAITIIGWLLIRQLSRVINLHQNYTPPSHPQQINPVQDRPYHQEALPRPVSSVTEHTTRNFAPARDDEQSSRDRF